MYIKFVINDYIEDNMMDDNSLVCPYDLSNPHEAILWEIDCKKHWYKEGFKLSYPNLYKYLKIGQLYINIVYLKLHILFDKIFK